MRDIIPETYFSFSEHTQLFFFSCLLGVMLGIIYDFFRAFRIIIPHNSILVMIEDIAFSVIYIILIISFTSAFARGEFRVFYIFGNILGFILYFCSVGRIALMIIKKIVSLIKSVLLFIFKPFSLLYITVRKKFHGKFVTFYENFHNHLKILFSPLIEHPKMLYNNKVIHKRKNVKSYAGKKEKTKDERKNLL